MSDLAASHCGCNQTLPTNDGCFNNSCIWIILLLFFCGGCGNGFGFFNDNDDCRGGRSNNSCLWIILLLIFCGNNGFGGCGCGCGC